LEKGHDSTRKTLSQASKQVLLRYSGRTELSRIEEEEEEKLTEDCTIERVLHQHAKITDENGKKLSSLREGMENKRRKKLRL